MLAILSLSPAVPTAAVVQCLPPPNLRSTPTESELIRAPLSLWDTTISRTMYNYFDLLPSLQGRGSQALGY